MKKTILLLALLGMIQAAGQRAYGFGLVFPTFPEVLTKAKAKCKIDPSSAGCKKETQHQ